MTILNPKQLADQQAHDKAIENYGVTMLRHTMQDIERHKPFDQNNPDHRWLMARRAAILRKLLILKAL